MSEQQLLNAAIIIQARMGSSRLPGKTLLPLAGKRMLEHVVQRLSVAPVSGPLIVATSENPTDDFICSLADSQNYVCVRGDEDDVLDRFWKAVKDVECEYIVRATADNPLVYEGAAEHLGSVIRQTGCDYITYTGDIPVGMGVEVFKKDCLKAAHEEATDPGYREHVTPFIYYNPDRFDIIRLQPPHGLRGRYRLTVDTQQDYELVKEIYARLYTPGKIIPALAVIELLEKEPELVETNAGVEQRKVENKGS